MLLKRYGACANRVIYRPQGWAGRLRAGKLPVGNATGAGEQRPHELFGYPCWENAECRNVGNGGGHQGQHLVVPASKRHAARPRAPAAASIFEHCSSCQQEKSLCCLWRHLHPAAGSTCSRSWHLLLTSLQRHGSSQKVALMGLHGQRRAWAIHKMDEADALNVTIQRLMDGA